MPGALMWVWDDTAGEWVKMQVTAGGLIEVSVGNFPDDYPLPAAQVTDLKKITEAPDPVISQATATNLKHVPHAQVTGNGVYKPLQLDASDYLMVAIKALAHLNDIDDVNIAAPTDGWVVYWDAAAGKFQVKALAFTKEFFEPINTTGTTPDDYFAHTCKTLDVEDEFSVCDFGVPADFSSIIAAELFIVSSDTQAAVDYDISSSYGAEGQNCVVHQESDTTSTYSVSAGIFYAIDISGILSSLAAGDVVGIKLIKQVAVGTETWVKVFGIHFKYS